MNLRGSLHEGSRTVQLVISTSVPGSVIEGSSGSVRDVCDADEFTMDFHEGSLPRQLITVAIRSKHQQVLNTTSYVLLFAHCLPVVCTMLLGSDSSSIY